MSRVRTSISGASWSTSGIPCGTAAMVQTCSAYGCKNRYHKDKDISFHKYVHSNYVCVLARICCPDMMCSCLAPRELTSLRLLICFIKASLLILNSKWLVEFDTRCQILLVQSGHRQFTKLPESVLSSSPANRPVPFKLTFIMFTLAIPKQSTLDVIKT